MESKGRLGRRDQRRSRLLGLAGREPVLGHEPRRGAARRQPLGDLTVEPTPTRPRHLGIESLPRQCVSEGGKTGLDLDDEAARERFQQS